MQFSALAAAGVAASLMTVAGPSVPARADDGVEIRSVTTSSLTFGTEDAKTITVRAFIDGNVSDANYYIRSARDNCYLSEYESMRYVGNHTWEGKFTITQADVDTSCAGAMSLEVTADDFDHGGYGFDEYDKIVYLKRWARAINNNASPEPINKGGTLTISADLQRANWDGAYYEAVAYAPMELQYRTASGSYRTVTTVKTNARGQVSTRRTQNEDGCWRWVFRGYTTTVPSTTTGDCVNVS